MQIFSTHLIAKDIIPADRKDVSTNICSEETIPGRRSLKTSVCWVSTVLLDELGFAAGESTERKYDRLLRLYNGCEDF